MLSPILIAMQDSWYRRAQLVLNKGEEELAREALRRRKSLSDAETGPAHTRHAAAAGQYQVWLTRLHVTKHQQMQLLETLLKTEWRKQASAHSSSCGSPVPWLASARAHH